MFSTGQMVFALLFAVTFISVVVVMYRKDKKWHKTQYKGVSWVLLGFISFLIILLLLKYILRN